MDDSDTDVTIDFGKGKAGKNGKVKWVQFQNLLLFLVEKFWVLTFVLHLDSYAIDICAHRRKVSAVKTEKLGNPGVSLPDLQPSSSVLLPSKVRSFPYQDVKFWKWTAHPGH